MQKLEKEYTWCAILKKGIIILKNLVLFIGFVFIPVSSWSGGAAFSKFAGGDFAPKSHKTIFLLFFLRFSKN